jgi:hypothetical protein
LKPDAQNDVDTGVTLCAFNYRIDNNSAPDGAAIYGDSDEDNIDLYGSNVYLNPGFDCGPEPIASLGAVDCAAGQPCNEISGNDALDKNNNPSGAIVTMETYDNFAVERLAMRGNHAKQMILAEGPYEDVLNYVHGCLIVDNHTSQELIHSDSFFYGDALAIANCTLADNTIDNGYSIYSAGRLTLTDSIIYQPGRLALDHVTGSCDTTPCPFQVDYMMSNDVSTLPSSSNIITIDPADPLFVDAPDGNYQLVAYYQNGSLVATRAIDFAPTESGDAAHDFNGNAYGQNVPAVPDAYGTRDLGAYEMTPITDRIFADAFGDRTSLVYSP